MSLVVEKQVGLQCPRINVIIPRATKPRTWAHILSYIPSIVSEGILVDGHSTSHTHSPATFLSATDR